MQQIRRCQHCNKPVEPESKIKSCNTCRQAELEAFKNPPACHHPHK